MCCSSYLISSTTTTKMENYQGDLADIIRASASASATAAAAGTNSDMAAPPLLTDTWQFSDHPMDYPPDDFGIPFSSSLQDPLLQEIGVSNNSSFFNSDMVIKNNSIENSGIFSQNIVGEEMNMNIFSRMLQISPINDKLSCDNSPLIAIKPPTLAANDVISANGSKGCLVENTIPISSPRNTGIKRRKSQAKKVVCIPAPAPANSRPTGEIVPSDLWAWRKYGQKPIKGSPYPRGYYRCSSSKGCSARKQVERSRTDPNMLVITYTSEHNHPWPTQRNALAGSTRTQPSKNNSGQKKPPTREEPKESNTDHNLSVGPPVKEERENLDMEDGEEFNEGFPQSYMPALGDSNNSEDFFADLGEIEGDPLNLLFTHGFSGDEERENNKGNSNELDPFSFYDWTGSSS